ncbi:MAG TPA: NAD(P)-binding domain-containing protein [Flavobacteriales bacterium]|nr:NAD(P)-binding domain-containing protein [Flavobacteriales bacterium]
MNITVLGTGSVGQTIGSKLIELGHNVKMGSRSATNEKAVAWAAKYTGKASVGTFADAAAFGELVFNCTLGMESVNILKSAGENNLNGKVLIDVSNPLDFSKGMPPSLGVCNTGSLGEEIQKAFTNVKVVKTLNTMWCGLMVNPALINGGDHQVFMCGNDAGAKSTAKEILNSFGWNNKNIMDLGDITGARGTEMWLPLWLRIYGTTKSGSFNMKLVS